MAVKKRIFIFLILLVTGLTSSSQLLVDKKLLKALTPQGLRNPDVQLPSFDLMDNNQIRYTNASLLNKVTIINFWFEACSPCITEIEPLNILYNKYKKDSSFLFLSFSTDSSKIIQKMINNFSIFYPVISVSSPDIYKYNFNLGFPTTMIVDKQGKIRYLRCGGETDLKSAKKSIETLYYPVIDTLLTVK